MKTVVQRFHEGYRVDEESGCWLWFKASFRHGYGAIGWNYKTLKAHRLSYQLHRGPIPEGALVCHKCDTPACVNPEHLFLGSPKDNCQDRNAKGRNADIRGESNPRARLTIGQVREIRSASGTNSEIAERYGIRQPQVSRIKSGKRWAE